MNLLSSETLNLIAPVNQGEFEDEMEAIEEAERAARREIRASIRRFRKLERRN